MRELQTVNQYNNWPELIVGNEIKVPVESNKFVRYVNFDNAASTSAFKRVVSDVSKFLQLYGSIHRGEGFKSRFSTDKYENCREQIARFIGLDYTTNTIVFVKNTTEAINKLANCLDFTERNIVISTCMEHHSNDLPWRKRANMLYAKILSDGSLDYDHLIKLFDKFSDKVRLLTVTGASNVSGCINDIGILAQLAHRHGAEIMVDAAQLIPHRKICMFPDDHPEHIDYLVFSGHKIYAPFGIGVLAGPKKSFADAEPDYVGGGTISIVTHEEVYWADVPDKLEAGTPNVIGAVALSSAIGQLEDLGMSQVEEHETRLNQHFIHRISEIPQVKLYGHNENAIRLGVFSFSVEGFNHSLIAARLSYEAGIGVRSGCFCAHAYVLSLLNISLEETQSFHENIKKGNKQDIPGLVRVSFGLYNTINEVDYFIKSLKNIIDTPDKNSCYFQDIATGKYDPAFEDTR
ncbi:MAG: aminotransferase class V-fold PLP-dependent enzyme [Thermincola sp.]|jgi:selenocysteine lyase/cysteine desulfurase|nr:aminotransferase class V-fold PLP-dependent enzyme [Thermincola sp.]MDT3703580.1 aminotransferase class V-fold PLP-dependent enzyme [Thermincola sp.]